MFRNLINLFSAHALGDGAFQTAYMASHKATSIIVLLSHAGVVAAVFWVFTRSRLVFALQLVGHFLIDFVTSRYVIPYYEHGLVVDQMLHAVTILLCLMWMCKEEYGS